MPDTPKRVPRGKALQSTDADLDAASVITPEDVARMLASAPEPVQAYLRAAPDDADDAPTA